jgi:hypothetical protein
LMPALIENPAISDNMLMELAADAPREIASVLLASSRVRQLPGVIEALAANPRVLPAELQTLHLEQPHPEDVHTKDVHTKDDAQANDLRIKDVPETNIAQPATDSHSDSPCEPKETFPEFPVVPQNPLLQATPAPAGLNSGSTLLPEPESTTAYADGDPETEAVRLAWEKQYAAEIAAVESEPFELVSVEESESASADTTEGEGAAAVSPETAHQQSEAQETVNHEAGIADQTASPASAGSETSSQSMAIAALALHQKAAAIDAKKLTIMQRVGRMKASERVKTAFIGGKEERAILIRDRARIVQNAVLSSPKITDSEVELFAAAKNLDENVLREIARNRRFMKNYPVVRNLATNPKTPLDVAMPLVKMLMVFDLKSLQKSKSVSEIIRKMAQKYYQEKATSGGKTKS